MLGLVGANFKHKLLMEFVQTHVYFVAKHVLVTDKCISNGHFKCAICKKGFLSLIPNFSNCTL